ncbi:MAG: right-handed parallel beta-helix repeat-containing protein, partial [Planctomycetes bacterium]|nr:right-handed parallel beta-helix repeat-containing protein [Planctomycetota bacterium]
LTNVTITGNSANRGGGIDCSHSDPFLTNVTITGNSAIEGGGIYCRDNSNPTVINSIFYNNSPQEIYFRGNSDPNSVTIAYSDLMGGEAGIVTNGNGTVNWLDGNIDQDPLFIDPGNDDYHLQPGSPCIDAGNPDPQYNDGCLPPGLGTEMNDMGAYGGPGNCDWLLPGITGTVDLVGTDDESGIMIFAQEIPGHYVFTAMDGFYELTLPLGTYTIVAQKPGYQYGYAYNVVVEF